MRARLYQELAWLRGSCNLEVLSDRQLCDLAQWVRNELAQHGRARCPVAGKVVKERRMGRTNRLGWRWVVYTAPTIPNVHRDNLEWSERSVCTSRQDAWKEKSKIMAVEAAHHAQERLRDVRVSCG